MLKFLVISLNIKILKLLTFFNCTNLQKANIDKSD